MNKKTQKPARKGTTQNASAIRAAKTTPAVEQIAPPKLTIEQLHKALEQDSFPLQAVLEEIIYRLDYPNGNQQDIEPTPVRPEPPKLPPSTAPAPDSIPEYIKRVAPKIATMRGITQDEFYREYIASQTPEAKAREKLESKKRDAEAEGYFHAVYDAFINDWLEEIDEKLQTAKNELQGDIYQINDHKIKEQTTLEAESFLVKLMTDGAKPQYLIDHLTILPTLSDCVIGQLHATSRLYTAVFGNDSQNY